MSDRPVQRRRYVPAVGPRLRRLLYVVLGLTAIMGVNSVYLVAVRAAGWARGDSLESYFSLWMFLAHLIFGLALLVPVVVFGAIHIRNARGRRNRRAVRAGYALFIVSLVLLLTGVALTRLEGLIEIKDPATRSALYWVHAVAPLVVVWLFILHRLAGPKIRWRVGLGWGGVAAAFAIAMVLLHAQDPRQWDQIGPESGERYFFPSLARTATGNFIDADVLMRDDYCKECHEDVHDAWAGSMHRFASFNNPVYLFSVRETRRVALERDGSVQAARFCAGCHDPVVFFSGAFDDPEFDDENHPTSQAGITCSVCHSITHLNSPRGNSDYTIDEPLHYPFATSDNPLLAWVNRQLVKARPGLHKRTFLKPLHSSAEFCGTCHKVHLPEELNDYKWLRGQNHYDSWLLSGVSGHGAQSFYYPDQAVTSCTGANCHMEPIASDDFGARILGDSGELEVHDHRFPSANTGVPHLLDLPDEVIETQRRYLEGVARVDIFGLREGGRVGGNLLAPLRPSIPVLEPGGEYLVETVIRTLKLGHLFTEGTADSNQVWLDVTVRSGDRVIGRSGGLDERRRVDPWSHFVNAYVLDRDGNRVDRRNAQDIFVPLYNNQIPPGAGDVVHYRLQVPEGLAEPVTIEVALRYRKFDTTLMEYVTDDPDHVNDLPIVTIATDTLTLPVQGPASEIADTRGIPEWQRWNDYGIGLLRKSDASGRGQLRQAAAAFREVERLGRPDGPTNLARVHLQEGRLDEAAAALQRASGHAPAGYPWTIAWLAGLVERRNGHLDEAIEQFTALLETGFPEARRRGFDFSRDYRVLNELGQTLFDRAKLERGEARRPERERLLRRAAEQFQRVLETDPENVTAHYNLAQLHTQLGDPEAADRHRALHARYKPDDNARDSAVARHRAANPAADHAAEAVVIYDLHRPGAHAVPVGDR